MSATFLGSWRARPFLGLIAVLAVSSSMTRSADAQDSKPKYSVIPISAELRDGEPENKRLLQSKSRAAGGSASFAQTRADLDMWYGKYFFYSFTHLDQMGKLPLKRRELLSDLARTGSRQSTQELYLYLRKEAEKYGKGFAGSAKYHPAVRFNAMLLLGDLNAKEKSVAEKRRFPQPYTPMLGPMVIALRDPKQIDAVKVAALIGILRHAKLQWYGSNPRISAKARTAILREVYKIVIAQQPPAGRSEAGHAWMQRRSIEILAAFKIIGQSKVINDKIASIVANPAADLSLRCTAAKSFSQLNMKGKGQIDADAISLKLGALAAHCVQTDLAWIDGLKLQKEIKKISKEAGEGGGGGGAGSMSGGAMGDMMGGGGMDGQMGAPDDDGGGSDDQSAMMGSMGMSKVQKDPELDLAQRKLRSKLDCVQRGLAAVADAAQGNTQVRDVSKLVDALMQATEPPEEDPTLDALAKELKRKIRSLEALTKSAVPEPSEETPVSAAPSAAPVSGVPSATRPTATKGG